MIEVEDIDRVKENHRPFILGAAFVLLMTGVYLLLRGDVWQSSFNFSDDKLYLGGPKKCNISQGPYIYATTHDEVANILKYTLDGCLVTDKVLLDGPELDDHDTEFRSMAFGKYKGHDALFIADAMTKDSFVFAYSECDANGQRTYLGTPVSSQVTSGVDHTYGLCFDDKQNLYITNQHTDNVMRFAADTFEPMALPSSLEEKHSRKKFYPGTFVQFGAAAPHDVYEQGIRSILHYRDTIWIANENIDGVAVADINTGIIHDIVVVHCPIGLFFDETSGLIFIGSKAKHWGGGVYAVSPKTLRIVANYTTHRMNHPTGITVHQDILYVAEQTRGEILVFRVSTQEYLGRIVKKTPGQIELLLLSDC